MSVYIIILCNVLVGSLKEDSRSFHLDQNITMAHADWVHADYAPTIIGLFSAMIRENQQLVINEPVEYEN